MKLCDAHQKDFDFILKLTRQNMERIVTREWNPNWKKDVEPNSVNLWKSQGEKKRIDVDNRRDGYFWFEQHSEKRKWFSLTLCG